MIGQWALWLLIFGVGYAYFIYPALLWVLNKWKNNSSLPDKNSVKRDELPEITLFIPAYNEKDFIDEKVRNTRELNYPAHLLKVLWVTDGSDDGTPGALSRYPDMEVLHEAERNGKIGAMNRGISYVQSPLVVFTDANTYLGKDTLLEIAALFTDVRVGCVAGEKRIYQNEKADAVSSGEGLYWKYESAIKLMEARLGSVVGAAGELFAIRRKLYVPIERDTLLDDFVISMRIAMQGYEIKYSPQAYAIERASVSITEEMKRKVRIATGGFQTFFRLKGLLNVFRYRFLSFTYFSHKVMRWIFVPLAMPLIFLLNVLVILENDNVPVFYTLLVLQVVFYFVAALGWRLQHKELNIKWLFAPYYIFIMNLAMYKGFLRFMRGKSSVNWERAKRV